ncbi:MAG: GIY-YIG nuclease family protein [Bacteroidales bacterium]|nr:GIY-YIG nuclease family protein [Bacteroidales bacterium]
MDTYYTGSCLDLEKRLIQHKDKEFSSSFTSKADDWKLFLKIDGLEYNQARKIEAHIKKMKSKEYIKNLVKYPDIVKRLKQKF